MTSIARRLRQFPGTPAVSHATPLLRIGFRPFFLLAASFAVLLVPCWLLVRQGSLPWKSPLAPVHWHAHEMLFGYTSAVIAGFLLTATQNWTGRVTARGWGLMALAALWLAGRILSTIGGGLPLLLVAAIDVAFLPALAVCVAVPIVRTRNLRNAAMPMMLIVLACANGLLWAGALASDGLALLRAQRLALDLVALLILVIGGRVLPGFTANALPGAKVRTRNALDVAGIASVLVLLALDGIAPRSRAAAYAALFAGVVNLGRLWGWGGSRAFGLEILAVLHVGFACTALALGLRGIALQTNVLPESTATHLLTVGGIGSTTLGMMARVALGHTGRPLVLAPSIVVALYALAASALVRVLGPVLFASYYAALLWLSGALWTLAFALYLVHYTPILLAARADGRPG